MKNPTILLLMLLLSFNSFNQNDSTSNNNPLSDTVNLDNMELDDVFDLGNNHYRFDNYKEAEFIYTYLYEKGYFSKDNNTSFSRITARDIYWRMVYFNTGKHDYVNAQHFLDLALAEPSFKHFCGNAIIAQVEKRDSYILECKLGLAEGERQKELLGEMISRALTSNLSMNSYNAHIYRLINYLKSQYSVNEIVYFFRKSRENLTASQNEDDYNSPVECKLRIFDIETSFSVYFLEYDGIDSQILKKLACSYMVDRIKTYSGYGEVD